MFSVHHSGISPFFLRIERKIGFVRRGNGLSFLRKIGFVIRRGDGVSFEGTTLLAASKRLPTDLPVSVSYFYFFPSIHSIHQMENTNTITLHENASGASSDVHSIFASNLFDRLLSYVIQFFQSCLPIIPTVENVSTSTPNDNGNTSCRDYDVFINHRGPDVKATFATYLYRRLGECGLKVFLDEPEMQVGDVITGQIKQAIETASIHVAVFSPTYAESTWCLEELAHMFERYKSGQAIIIPVFYEVDPSEVRLTDRVPTRNYVQALRKKKKRFKKRTIQKWREALQRVADLSGLELKKCNGEEELVREVLGQVLERHEKRRLKYVTKDEDEFGRTVQSCQAKCVGIVGPAGVGKTTLAKQFFNKKRSGYRLSCFISDVKENTTEGSLISMQKKLIKDFTQLDVEIDTIDQGINLLKKHISSCSVLIILDNVDDASQMDAVLPIRGFLGSNSLILVTSRDENVFERRITEVSIYNLTGLKTVRPRTSLILAGPWLKHLPPWLGQLTNLKELWLRDSPNLKCLSRQQSFQLPKGSGGLYRLLKQLTELTVMDCGIQSLSPDLEKMNNLNVLRVYNCPLGELSFGRKVEDRVICSRDAKLLGAASKWEPPFSQCVCPNLQSLWINSCRYLVKVGSLPTTLTALDFSYCKRLKQIEGLCYLARLEKLDISGCEELEELQPLDELKSLKELKAFRCSNLKRIQGLAGTKLQIIYIRECDEIKEMPDVERLLSLKKLDVCGCLKLQWGVGVFAQLQRQLNDGFLHDSN